MPRFRAIACPLFVLMLSAGLVAGGETGEEPSTPPAEEQPSPPEEGQGDESADAASVAARAEQGVAEGTPRGKWHTFSRATRGLLTWNLLEGRLTLGVYARAQVEGTLARASQELEPVFGDDRIESLDVRRLTVQATGTIDKHLAYNVGWEFGADPGPWNAYVEGLEDGLRVFGYNIGNFRAGLFQEPFSLERKTSDAYLGFPERSLPIQTFAPGNNLGYMVFNNAAQKRMHWAVGFFSRGKETENNASISSLSLTGRVTGLPIWRQEGRQLLHLGVAYSNRQAQDDDVRYRSRPEARFVDVLADTGAIDASLVRLYGFELAAQSGPVWLQAEATLSRVSPDSAGDLDFWGNYIQAGWFLTGESRPYYLTEALWDRVVPQRGYSKGLPLKRSSGGAFELVARRSQIDLNDGAIRGGELVDLSVGLNWYANATSRVMLHYIRSDVEDGGHAKIGVLRWGYRPLPR